MSAGKGNGRTTGGDRRPRRELLAGAAAILGVVTAEAVSATVKVAWFVVN